MIKYRLLWLYLKFNYWVSEAFITTEGMILSGLCQFQIAVSLSNSKLLKKKKAFQSKTN